MENLDKSTSYYCKVLSFLIINSLSYKLAPKQRDLISQASPCFVLFSEDNSYIFTKHIIVSLPKYIPKNHKFFVFSVNLFYCDFIIYIFSNQHHYLFRKLLFPQHFYALFHQIHHHFVARSSLQFL